MLWGCERGPRLLGDSLAAELCAGFLSHFDSGGVGFLSPTFQWIFILGLISISLKYITKETFLGRARRRIFRIWGSG